MDLLARAGEGYRGEVAYNPLSNKKLKIEKEGELTRERGVFRKTRKVQKRDDDGNVYVGRLEKESRRKKATYEFDANGELTGKSAERKDGSFEEKWERDENGELIRTKFSTSRLRDVGFGPAVSEEMSASFERAGRKYRTLTRQKGSKKKVFERDGEGNLELIGRESGSFSKYTRKSRDGKTSQTDIKHGSRFGKSYKSRLDADGKELSRDITSVRRLWNKHSAKYDDETGKMTSAKHTFGKLYESETTYGETHRYKARKILGLRLSSKLEALSTQELADQQLRADDAAQHKDAWSSGIVVHQTPAPGTTKQLGGAERQTESSVVGLPSRQNSMKANEAAAITPEDEEEAFLKRIGPATPGRTASLAVAKGADPKTAALLSNWQPITEREAETPNLPSRQNSVKSTDGVSVTPEDDEEAFLKRLGPPTPGKASSTLEGADAKTDAILSGWEQIGSDDAHESPSRWHSVDSSAGSSITLDADDAESARGLLRTSTAGSTTSTLVTNGLNAADAKLPSGWSPIGEYKSHSAPDSMKGVDAATRRGYHRDRESLSLV